MLLSHTLLLLLLRYQSKYSLLPQELNRQELYFLVLLLTFIAQRLLLLMILIQFASSMGTESGPDLAYDLYSADYFITGNYPSSPSGKEFIDY